MKSFRFLFLRFFSFNKLTLFFSSYVPFVNLLTLLFFSFSPFRSFANQSLYFFVFFLFYILTLFFLQCSFYFLVNFTFPFFSPYISCFPPPSSSSPTLIAPFLLKLIFKLHFLSFHFKLLQFSFLVSITLLPFLRLLSYQTPILPLLHHSPPSSHLPSKLTWQTRFTSIFFTYWPLASPQQTQVTN